MIPAYQIIADDTDVTVSMARYLTMLRIVDKRGVEADECEIELVDPDGSLNLPRRGVRLQIMMGWENSLQDKGSFIIDQVSENGPPDRITITGCSADFQGDFKVQREESYSGKTIGQILTTIAKRHNLIPAIEEQLAGILIDHIDQTNESDPNFLTRLGTDYDAIATVKAGRLLFMPVGHAKTVSGLVIPAVTITRDSTVSHQFQITDRESSYTGVRAKWRDHKANTTKYSTAGTGEKWKTLKRDYPTAVAAFHAAKSEWARMQRGQKTINLDLAVGNPSIHAGQPLRLSGWRDEISGTSWVTGEVTHKLTENGITASFEAEEQIT